MDIHRYPPSGVIALLSAFFSSVASSLFGLPTRRSLPRNNITESRVLTLDDPRAWDDFINVKSSAGVNVTHDAALGCAAVWQAVSMISSDVAGLTLNCYKRREGGDRDIDEGHPAQPLVTVQANEETSSLDFWGQIVAHATLWGNGYAYVSRKEGRLYELVNLLPDRTYPARTATGLQFYITEVGQGNGRRKREPLKREEIFHLKGLTLQKGTGADLVAYARDAIGLALAAEEFNGSFFAGGCQVAGILEIPPTFTDKAAANLEEGFRKRTANSDDKFKVAILRDGAKFQKLTATAQESQTHELREDQVRDVARFFNLPPSKLGIPGSVSYNSAEMAQLEYLQSCLTAWLRRICAECGMKLLTKDERLKTHYFEHNTSNFIEIDTTTLGAYLRSLVEATIINPNEARKKINLPPRPGGDVYGNPNTNTTEDTGATEGDPEPKAEPETQTEQTQPADDIQATALNGAQITSLVAIVDKLALKQLPPDGVRALIQAAFPAMSLTLIDKIVGSLESFEPIKAEPAPVSPPPATEEEVEEKEEEEEEQPDNLSATALRPILADLINRFAHRLTKDARSKVEKPVKFQELVDTKASEYRRSFDESLRATVAVVGAINNVSPEGMLAMIHGRFFAAFVDAMSPVLDKPTNELATNVEAACKAFEDGIAEAICDAVLIERKDP